VLRSSVLGLAATAGCGFGGTSDEVGVSLENRADAAHRLSVTVSFEDSTLVDETVTLSPGESTRTTFQNPETAGSARVDAVRDDASARATEDVRVGPGTGIRDIFVEITEDGRLTVFAGRT
jgi:hypothetical protein